MPGINDEPEQVEQILELAEEAGAVSVGGIALHLRGEVRGIFLDWLRSHRPDLVQRYERLYARGAYVHRGREPADRAAGGRGPALPAQRSPADAPRRHRLHNRRNRRSPPCSDVRSRPWRREPIDRRQFIGAGALILGGIAVDPVFAAKRRTRRRGPQLRARGHLPPGRRGGHAG